MSVECVRGDEPVIGRVEILLKARTTEGIYLFGRGIELEPHTGRILLVRQRWPDGADSAHNTR
ncbi:MAG: hypothetical protein ACI9S9_001696 [Planctomycetota bacterium]